MQVGLDVLWRDGTVFGCYTSMWDVIYYSEIGSSWAVLKAGFSIDSLMLRYQGVDWTAPENWECNARCLSHPVPTSKHEHRMCKATAVLSSSSSLIPVLHMAQG